MGLSKVELQFVADQLRKGLFAPWDDTTGYTHPAFCVGSNNLPYYSVQSSGVDSSGAAINGGAVDPVFDSDGSHWLPLALVDTTLSEEQVQDIVGAMVTDNTETNTALSYDDTNGKLNGSVPNASETVRGVAELANTSEADNGSDDSKIMTPALVKRRVDTRVPTNRNVNTSGALSGGGSLGSDLNLSVRAASTIESGVVQLENVVDSVREDRAPTSNALQQVNLAASNALATAQASISQEAADERYTRNFTIEDEDGTEISIGASGRNKLRISGQGPAVSTNLVVVAGEPSATNLAISVAEASSSVAGLVRISTSTTSTSDDTVATSSAVRNALAPAIFEVGSLVMVTEERSNTISNTLVSTGQTFAGSSLRPAIYNTSSRAFQALTQEGTQVGARLSGTWRAHSWSQKSGSNRHVFIAQRIS